jgi:hypothetical protein
MNVEIGTKAAQFPEKEYLNGVFVAVWMMAMHTLQYQPVMLQLIIF